MDEAASRNWKRHSVLDTHITRILPDALPPRVDSPANFTLGILPFAYIFAVLESEWDRLSAQSQGDEGESARLIRAALSHAQQIPGLARTTHFRADLQHLRSRLGEDLTATEREDATPHVARNALAREQCDVFLAHVTCQRHDAAALNEVGPEVFHAQALTQRIIHFAQHKPHLIIAYIYVWYMAVLSGGQYILKTLKSVDPRFWGHEFSSSTEDAGFSFLSADPSIRDRLRRKLQEAEALLSAEQRAEVVEETELIYELTIRLVDDVESFLRDQLPVTTHERGRQKVGVTKEEDGLGQDATTAAPLLPGRGAQLRLLRQFAAVAISATICLQLVRILCI